MRFDGSSGGVVAELGPGADEPGLDRVRLLSEGCAFEVSRSGRFEACSTDWRGGELVGERMVYLGPSDVVSLLGEELKFLGRDEPYESALGRVAEMLRP